MRKSLPLAPSFQPIVWPNYRQTWLCLPAEELSHNWKEDVNINGDKKAMISVRDHDFLVLYYKMVFENLRQTNCRILAKAYIKLVEPRKQVSYPYNGRKFVEGALKQFDPDMTKPPWWPSGVTHREPDHLPKVGKETPIMSTYSTSNGKQSVFDF